MSPTIILGILLAISVAGNAWQYHEHDKLVAKAASFEQANGTLAAGVTACSDSVDNLDKEQRRRFGAMMTELQDSLPRIKSLQHDALAALQARPADPKDLCGSLLQELRARIKQERAGK